MFKASFSSEALSMPVFPMSPGQSSEYVTFILQNLEWLPRASSIKHQLLRLANIADSGLNLPF